MLVDSCPKSTVEGIEFVLLKADWEIHKIMVGHYSELIITINNKLEAMEDLLIKLKKTPTPLRPSIKAFAGSTRSWGGRRITCMRRVLQEARVRKAEYHTTEEEGKQRKDPGRKNGTFLAAWGRGPPPAGTKYPPAPIKCGGTTPI